jgi:hypothetical protein
MGKAEKLYNDLMEGNHIETNDLIFLRDHFETVATWCWQLGPIFKLSAIEAEKRMHQASDYLFARANL